MTVRVAFLYNESSIIPPHFHYGYEITQRMDKSGLEFQGTGFHFNLGDSKESMRLERRYWKIDSLNDHIDEVDGPGKASKPGIQINWIFNIDIDIANFEKSILILILLGQYIAKY